MDIYNHDEVVNALILLITRLKGIDTEQDTENLLEEIDAVANDYFGGHCCYVTQGKGEGTVGFIHFHEDDE